MSASVEREEEGTMKSDDRPKEHPPALTNEPGHPHATPKRKAEPLADEGYWNCVCKLRNTSKAFKCRNCNMTKNVSTRLFSITALPISADMRKSWHEDHPQSDRDFNVCVLVTHMSTDDPTEDIEDLVAAAQNRERNMYESANSMEEYKQEYKLVKDKLSKLKREKRMSEEKMKRSGQMDQKPTALLPLCDKEAIPLPGKTEDHPVMESMSSGKTEDHPASIDPSLELQCEPDVSSCSSSLRTEESSLSQSGSLPRQIPCTENKTSLKAKQSKSLNDVSLLDKTLKITPDIIVVENQEGYRFHSTQAGLFQCSVTGLVFKMKTEGDVTYRTVPWNQSLLAQLGKRPAGPLFDIKCPQMSLRQLHFPHCEILSTGGGKSLSVAHVMDEGIELIKPHVITESHIIINVTGLSLLGIILTLFSRPKPTQTHVSLFYSPPMDDSDAISTLNVLLLPGNVVLDEVIRKRKKLNGEEIYIEKPPCELIPKKEYTLSISPADDAIRIEPNKSKFKVDELSYHNYVSTFQVTLERRMKSVKLLLKDSNTFVFAWESCVNFSAPAVRRQLSQPVQRTQNHAAENRLCSVRSSFIISISDANLNVLLDKLFEEEVLNDAERETATGMMRNEKARFVIDAVRHKGSDASSIMIRILCDLDTFLSEHLGLI